MKSDSVYYIQPYSYTHHLSTQDIIKRFINSDIYNTITKEIVQVEEAHLNN